MIQDGGLHGRADECWVQGGIRRIRQSESVKAWYLSSIVYQLFTGLKCTSNILNICLSSRPSDSPLFKIILSISLSARFLLYFYVYLSVCLNLYPSVIRLPAHVCLYLYASVILSVFLSVCISIPQTSSLSSCLFVSLSLSHPLCLPFCLYLYPSVILSVYIFIRQLSCRFVSLSLSYPVCMYISLSDN